MGSVLVQAKKFDSPAKRKYESIRRSNSLASIDEVPKKRVTKLPISPCIRTLPKRAAVLNPSRANTPISPNRLHTSFISSQYIGSPALRPSLSHPNGRSKTPRGRNHFSAADPTTYLEKSSEGAFIKWINHLLDGIDGHNEPNKLTTFSAAETFLEGTHFLAAAKRIEREIDRETLKPALMLNLLADLSSRTRLVDLFVRNYTPHWLSVALSTFRPDAGSKFVASQSKKYLSKMLRCHLFDGKSASSIVAAKSTIFRWLTSIIIIFCSQEIVL